jgi:rubrerythrin
VKTPIRILSAVGVACCALLVSATNTLAKSSEQTIKNLNAAYQGESNASNRYAKFAEKADAEGYAQVAKLFRAASAAEAIHRDTHKAAILELGGAVETFQLDPVKPGATAESLKAAIKGESYERDTMYPEFIAAAKAENARGAIRAFQFAVAAEKEHAKLYQQALDTLGKNAPADYYVCQVCGMTLTELPAKKCPVCHKSRDEYRKIN